MKNLLKQLALIVIPILAQAGADAATKALTKPKSPT